MDSISCFGSLSLEKELFRYIGIPTYPKPRLYVINHNKRVSFVAFLPSFEIEGSFYADYIKRLFSHTGTCSNMSFKFVRKVLGEYTTSFQYSHYLKLDDVTKATLSLFIFKGENDKTPLFILDEKDYEDCLEGLLECQIQAWKRVQESFNHIGDIFLSTRKFIDFKEEMKMTIENVKEGLQANFAPLKSNVDSSISALRQELLDAFNRQISITQNTLRSEMTAVGKAFERNITDKNINGSVGNSLVNLENKISQLSTEITTIKNKSSITWATFTYASHSGGYVTWKYKDGDQSMFTISTSKITLLASGSYLIIFKIRCVRNGNLYLQLNGGNSHSFYDPHSNYVDETETVFMNLKADDNIAIYSANNQFSNDLGDFLSIVKFN